jgi:HAD superfamily hydrolase (TIGR01509 family)
VSAKASPPVRAIIFDSDGTLVDSEVPGLDALHGFCLHQGLNLPREQAHRQFHGVSLQVCMAWLAKQLDAPLGGVPTPERVTALTAGARAAMNDRFQQGLNAMPGADDLLAGLALPFCVGTNGPRQKVELALSLAGLRHHFADEHLFCAYEVGVFKPEPGLFLHAAAALGVPPAHCAVVEDSLPGVQAGLAAGMQVYCLHPREGMPPEMAEGVVFIAHLGELAQWLPAEAFSGRVRV